MTAERRTLVLLEGLYAISRLESDASIPSWAEASAFSSITRTADELSVVSLQDVVPQRARCERGWRCLRVAGTISFSAAGVLAALTAPLAEAGVGVFAVSTFDTDYLLVKGDDLETALDALRRRGFAVQVPSKE
jgi:hypothetical protein